MEPDGAPFDRSGVAAEAAWDLPTLVDLCAHDGRRLMASAVSGSAMSRAKPAGLRRNIAVAAENSRRSTVEKRRVPRKPSSGSGTADDVARSGFSAFDAAAPRSELQQDRGAAVHAQRTRARSVSS